MRFLRLKVNRMSIRKIKDWLIRKLGGRPASITVDGTTYFQVHHVRMPVTVVATDIMEDGYQRCMPETTARMVMARKIAEQIIDDKLCKIEYKDGPYGTVKRTMTVEILPPIEGR